MIGRLRRRLERKGDTSPRMLLAVAVAMVGVMVLVVLDPAWRVDAVYRATIAGHCVPSVYNDGTCKAPVRLPNGRRVQAELLSRTQGYAEGESVEIERHRSLIFGRLTYHHHASTPP
jgi:hypothetical protein